MDIAYVKKDLLILIDSGQPSFDKIRWQNGVSSKINNQAGGREVNG